jgi:Cu2+-containing amine oxidase
MPVSAAHPLDPLSAEEIRAAVAILRRERDMGPRWRFGTIELREPPKAALREGGALPREAILTCWNRDDGQTYKAVVSIAEDRVISWEHRPGEQANFTEDEFYECNEALKNDPQHLDHAHDDDERWPCGELLVQSEDDAGLPAWTAANRSIENTDVVLWYVFGIHHITRPEEWPVMPVDTVSFWLKPVGFFDRNPALDVPPA